MRRVVRPWRDQAAPYRPSWSEVVREGAAAFVVIVLCYGAVIAWMFIAAASQARP